MKFFNKKNYSKLLIIPVVLLVIFLILIFIFPGIERGIDLKGGNQIIVHYDEHKDYSSLETALKENYGLAEIHINEVRGINDYGLLIEFSLQKDLENAKDARSKLDFSKDLEVLKPEVRAILEPLVLIDVLDSSDLSFIEVSRSTDDLRQSLSETLSIANNNFYNQINVLVKTELNLEDDARIQTREIAPTLGNDFVKSSIKVGIVALSLLIIVILLFFREIIPSGLIIFAVIFDVFAALAGMALFKIPLSLTTIPALLMLIGYSVDTDILLSTRVLKDVSRDPIDSANSSVATGLTMTFTTMATVIVMLVISYFSQMFVIFEISVILLCGLVGDLISTWLFNAPALIKYAERKNAKN
jgi:preprotein translocase subunit SecF